MTVIDKMGIQPDIEQKIKQGGFFDLPKENKCRDKQHNPPMHICIPKGKGYRHVCPLCGQVTTIIPQQVTL